MRFGGSYLEPNASIQDKTVTSDPIIFDALPISPETEAALTKKPTGAEPVGVFGKVRSFVSGQLDMLSGDVIVLRKPRPEYTDDARMRRIQGRIFVNVQFLANGTIGNITVDDRADKGLGKKVIVPVRKIKFIPAKVDGKAIDTVRTLYYTFKIY